MAYLCETSTTLQAAPAQLLCRAIQRYPECRRAIDFGILVNQTRGAAHQIWRATARTASAPPNCSPSEVMKRNSRKSSSRVIPRSAPTRGSCSGASANPRRVRIGASHRANRVQKEQSSSKKSQPFACRPFPSVYSLVREIIVAPSLLQPRLTRLFSCRCQGA
jgi:hypothetical protein